MYVCMTSKLEKSHKVASIMLTCNSCNHKWPYKGKADYYTSCPKCHANVRVAELK